MSNNDEMKAVNEYFRKFLENKMKEFDTLPKFMKERRIKNFYYFYFGRRRELLEDRRKKYLEAKKRGRTKEEDESLEKRFKLMSEHWSIVQEINEKMDKYIEEAQRKRAQSFNKKIYKN